MEQLLISYILIGKIKIEDISPDLITNPLAFKVYRALVRLIKNDIVPSVDSLVVYFKEKESESEYLKLKSYLTALKGQESDLPPEEVLSMALKSLAIRQVKSNIEEIAKGALDKDLDAVTEGVKSLNSSLDVASEAKPILLGEEIADNIASIPSTFETLNSLGNPLTGLVIIGGASGLGKSAYCVQEASGAISRLEDVAYFSLEMPPKLLENRLLSNLGGIPFGDLMRDSYSGDGHVPLSPYYEELRAQLRKDLLDRSKYGSLYILDSVFDGDEILANIKRLARRGVKLFVIDYLGLCTFKTNSGNSWAELRNLVIELNKLCMELGIVILLPTQITLEKQPDGTLSYITKGSSELKNSATLALLLYQTEDSKEAGLIELHVSKSRNGRKAVIGLESRLDIGRLNDMGIVSGDL